MGRPRLWYAWGVMLVGAVGCSAPRGALVHRPPMIGHRAAYPAAAPPAAAVNGGGGGAMARYFPGLYGPKPGTAASRTPGSRRAPIYATRPSAPARPSAAAGAEPSVAMAAEVYPRTDAPAPDATRRDARAQALADGPRDAQARRAQAEIAPDVPVGRPAIDPIPPEAESGQASAATEAAERPADPDADAEPVLAGRPRLARVPSAPARREVMPPPAPPSSGRLMPVAQVQPPRISLRERLVRRWRERFGSAAEPGDVAQRR